MDDLWNDLQAVDPKVLRSDTQAKHLKSKAKLQEFLEHCTFSRKYFFMVKKCGAPECDICRPPRLEMPMFNTLKNFPDPEPREDDPSRYKWFDDVYGKHTSERFCPSVTQMLAPISDSCSVKKSAETVCDYAQCVDCRKPRCVYSGKKLSKEDCGDLNILKESVIYTCGRVFVQSDHILHGTIGAQPNAVMANTHRTVGPD